MKKGIIIEKKGSQKVVLTDNGRFYIRPSKPGEQVGDSVMISTSSAKIAAAAFVLFLFSAAFYCGYLASEAINAKVADTLVQVDFGGGAEFLANGRGMVLSAAPLSESAAMISLEDEYRGLHVKDAVLKFVEYALLCGLVNFEENCSALYINVVGDDSVRNSELSYAIKRHVENFLQANLIRTVILSNLYGPEAGVQASEYECSVPKLRAMYIVSRIYRSSGDDRDFGDILRELKQKDMRSLLNEIREQHVRYNHSLGIEEREQLSQSREAFISLNRGKLDSMSNSQDALLRYQSFLQKKHDYENFFWDNFSERFSAPAYLNCD